MTKKYYDAGSGIRIRLCLYIGLALAALCAAYVIAAGPAWLLPLLAQMEQTPADACYTFCKIAAVVLFGLFPFISRGWRGRKHALNSLCSAYLVMLFFTLLFDGGFHAIKLFGASLATGLTYMVFAILGFPFTPIKEPVSADAVSEQSVEAETTPA